MRRVLLALLVFSTACATVQPVTTPPDDGYGIVRVPTMSLPKPSSDPVGVVVPSEQSVHIGPTASELRSVQVVPIGVPLALTFCSTTPRWTALQNEDRWYMVTIDGAQRDWVGALTQLDATCFATPKAYSFAVGSHDVAVVLVYPPTRTVECALGDPTCDTSCAVGQICYGAATTFTVTATSVNLAGPPPSVVKGQVLR